MRKTTMHVRLKKNSPVSTKSNDTSSWNARLKTLAKDGLFLHALHLYRQMQLAGVSPDGFTFPFAVKSCSGLSLPESGEQFHCQIIKTGCESEIFVKTALISMYSKCSLLQHARQLFDKTPQPNLVCWNALIAGYTLNCQFSGALSLFRQMYKARIGFNTITMLGLIPACAGLPNLNSGMSIHACNVKSGTDNDASVGNCLLTMYSKCGAVNLARQLFDEMPGKELITWNAMISGYAQNGLADQVLTLYRDMELYGVNPDPVSLVSVLSSCAHIGAFSIGRKVEEYISRSGFGFNVFLTNALINMYARCGNLVHARKLFDKMPQRNVISWTAIIAGYGMHGHGETATQLFDKMRESGIQPDGVVFVSVLSACSHAGLTEKGWVYFLIMKKDYRLVPGPEHYACMVDLLGRAGQLDEACELINAMRMKPDGAVWGALLGACKIHGRVELAELAFKRVVELEPYNVGYYVLLSNIYSEAKNYEGVAKIRVMMRERKLRKAPGCSYVELKGRVHLFLVGDKSHARCGDIYRMVEGLEESAKEIAAAAASSPGYQKKETEEEIVGVHSEKLAVAFGLLNTKAGAEFVVIKNLRVCGDCHLFIKLVSKIVDRQIVVRDASRFHHFKDGMCSCNDYW